MQRSHFFVGLLAATAACSNASSGDTPAPGTSDTTVTGTTSSGTPTGTAGPTSSTTGATGGTTPVQTTGATGSPSATTTTGATTTAGATTTTGAPSVTSSNTGGNTVESGAGSEPPGTSETTTAGPTTSGEGITGSGDPETSDEPTMGGGVTSSCVGAAWPSADPTKAGAFQVTADKEVGPLAGALPDPIYGDQQQRFNVYRPSNLAQTDYCHPILIWANGFRDNPEQKPPDCIVDSNANRWCGQYSPLLNHLASHGFVVVASLSTATAEGDPLPTIAGLDWILEQAEDPESPYYHRLDTSNIGQLGHSYGGMSTCMSASEPRYKALATICGTRALTGVHTPMLFFCGGQDDTVECDGVKNTFLTVTDQPAFFLNELNADHGSWVYQGAGGVSLSASAAWFRAHLMGDGESRKFFYGAGCRFCSDNRVETEQNALMMQ